MRRGWSCKEIAFVLDVAPTRATQSIEPALQKIAKLWRADSRKTLESLLAAMEQLDSLNDDRPLSSVTLRP